MTNSKKKEHSVSRVSNQSANKASIHHMKNKSAAIVIPKLDLSKLKRDVDQTRQTEENAYGDEIDDDN
jgi:hypothetical protein